MSPTSPPTASLGEEIVNRVETLVLEAEDNTRPLEVDPYRERLFELFVTAEGAGYLDGDAACDLSADGLCRLLGQRWGLRDAAAESFSNQVQIPKQHLGRMRSLWSVMRMWMEWEYAWNRWAEFHKESSDG
ncbi:MAG: hypothetical protein ACE5KM_07755 [Planctomycetaceae bacterium]